MKMSEQYTRASGLLENLHQQAAERFAGNVPTTDAVLLCQAHAILAVAEALNRIADAIHDDTARNTSRRQG